MELIILFYMFTSFVCCFITLVFFQTINNGYKYTNLPPSPPSRTILGHVHLLKTPLSQTFHMLSQKYAPIFSLRLGSRHVVVVSTLSGSEECFIRNDIILANKPPQLVAKYLAYNSTTIGSTSYGAHWRNLRRICVSQLLSSKQLSIFSRVREDRVKHLLCELSCNASTNGTTKVNLKSKFHELAFSIIMTMMIGNRSYRGNNVFDEKEIENFTQILSEVSTYAGGWYLGDYFPILNWFDFSGYVKKVKSLAKRTDAFLQSLIDEHRSKTTLDRDSKIMIDRLLTLQESEPDTYTDQIIKGLLLTLMSAAVESTSVTLEWAVSNLLNHPRVLQKAKDELDAQLGQERLMEESDLSKLHYLQCIITETIRLFPAAPMLVPRISSEDCTIAGFDIPRNTIIMINAWAIQRDSNMWNDPENFVPERFENGNSDTYKTLAFGLGRRSCPGEQMAKQVIGLTLGSLIQCFEWDKVSGEQIDMTGNKGLILSKSVALEAVYKARPIVNKVLC